LNRFSHVEFFQLLKGSTFVLVTRMKVSHRHPDRRVAELSAVSAQSLYPQSTGPKVALSRGTKVTGEIFQTRHHGILSQEAGILVRCLTTVISHVSQRMKAIAGGRVASRPMAEQLHAWHNKNREIRDLSVKEAV
jgi:hypothetical protein